MREGQPLSEGESIAETLLRQLGVSDTDLISGAYMDLILANQEMT